jgi:hypothetical protein
MQWLGIAARLIWESVGRKLAILPVVIAAAVSHFEIAPGQEIVAGPIDVQARWIIAAAIIVMWLIAGLLIKAVKLQMSADLDPDPDFPGQEAFRYLLIDSKWAVGRKWSNGNLYVDVEGELRDKAHQGRLKIWARDAAKMRSSGGGFRPTLMQIQPSEWIRLTFDLTSCVYKQWDSAHLVDVRADRSDQYGDVQMNRRQLMSVWPKAPWWEKWFDSDRKEREENYTKERNNGPR